MIRDGDRKEENKKGTATFITAQLFLHIFMKCKVLRKVPFNFKR